MTVSWAKRTALASSLLGILAVTNTALAQAVPEQPHFTKQAFDSNGNPVSGPVAAGTVLNFALGFNYGNVPPGGVTIIDQLSSGLTYLPTSLSALGWNYLPAGLPYSGGNQETYTNLGPGPAKSFTVNVPVSNVAQQAPTGGDGFYPIPIGNNVYELFHHQSYGSAQIYCVDRLSFIGCPGYPKSLDVPNTTDPRTTPQTVKVVVNGTRIYYPSASYDGQRTYFGIGCFDTAPGAPCAVPFIPLPTNPSLLGKYEGNGYNSGTNPLYPMIAGVVADSNDANRLFMYAIDKVDCVDVTTPTAPTGCNPWIPPTFVRGSSVQPELVDIMVGNEVLSSTPKKIYVYFGATGGKATVACLNVSDGSRCGTPWPGGDVQATLTSAVAEYGVLSPVLDINRTMTAVCLHPYINGPSGDSMFCFGATDGLPTTLPAGFNAMMGARNLLGTFHVPNSGRILYAQFKELPGISCFDFDNPPQPCTPFAPPWTSGTTVSPFEDYGYAVDTASPDRCLLGLGNAGKIWRFARDGSFEKGGCVEKIQQTLDLDGLFCATKPKEVNWTSIVLIKPPAGLSASSTITLSQGQLPFWTGTVAQAVNGIIPVNKSTLLSQGPVTLDFSPLYGAQPPQQGYQLQVIFSSDVDPQICYKATASCGPISNQASMQVGDQKPLSANVGLGNATGPACEPGILKVCKVAGPGITIGAPFMFTAGANTFSVPAGPPLGGTCIVGPRFQVGAAVTVTEAVPTGDTVSSIVVAPPAQLVGTPNLPGGSVNITIGTGVTEVTFTDKRTGYLEICKTGEVRGNFTFQVSPGALGPFTVPAGACSPAIEVVAGTVVITEASAQGTTMVGCTTIPPAQQGPCDPKAQTSTVAVAPGDISTMTIAFINNRRGSTNPGAAPAGRGAGSSSPPPPLPQ